MIAGPGALRFLLLLTIASLAALATTLARAQDALFTVTDGVLEGPATLAAGYHDLAVTNPGPDSYLVTVLRLKEGATREALIPAVEAVDQAFVGNGDPSAALNAALELADVYGEVNAAPESDGRTGLVLDPGTYLLITAPESDGETPPQNTFTTVEVTGEPQAEAPETAQTVQMVDFAFALPPDIEAGAQTWQVVNAGEQLHHMVIFKLHEGVTMADLQAWMDSEGAGGPPPADDAGYVGVMSPGRSSYVTLDLTPGEYVVICFMPDHRGNATGQPHFMLGMMQSFSIAGG